MHSATLKKAFSGFWDVASLPVYIFGSAALLFIVIVVPIILAESKNASRPITMSKCNGIAKTVDTGAKYIPSLDMCLSSKDDNSFYSYTVINGKIKREEVKL